MEPTTRNSVVVMASQTVFYFLIIWFIDIRRTNIFKRRQGGNPTTARSYAKLAVYEDAIDHAEKVKRS